MRTTILGGVIALATLFGAGERTALGQCEPVDFEGFAPGTDARTLIGGVTISAQPGSCGGPGSVLPIIVTPSGGTSSGTRALGLETGCPDFSPDWLRLVFDEVQDLVRFSVGTQSGTAGVDIQVRAYNGSGGLVYARTFDVAGGTNTFVRIATGNIARVEVESPISLFETIDDLEFQIDTTPPTVEITSPAFNECVCDGTVPIMGRVDDEDGDYGCDTFSYRRVNADESEPWVEVNTACGPFEGTLHVWDNTGLPGGSYYLRVVGRNECGLEESDVTVVRLDRSDPPVSVQSPGGAETVCGLVEFEGTVGGSCAGCFDFYTVEYSDSQSGPWTLITESGSPVGNDVFAEWPTVGLEDGEYFIRIIAQDICPENRTELITSVFVDNSAGFCECTPDLDGDGVVGTTDLLALLAAWGMTF